MEKRKANMDNWLEHRVEGFAAGECERDITQSFVSRARAHGDKVSRGSLFRWFRGFQLNGFAALADSRNTFTHANPNRQAFVDELKRWYLSSKKRTRARCFDLASDAFEQKGITVPFGQKQAVRELAKIDPKVVAYRQLGVRAYNSTGGKYLKGRYDTLDSNELWVSDGHAFDFFVRVPGQTKLIRPTLVSWMDMRSRVIVGWRIVACAENQTVILDAFRQGVEQWGKPLRVFHDNGEAYDAKSLQGVTKSQRRKGERPAIDVGVFSRLGIEVEHALPYNAKSKTLERFHRTVKEKFSREIPTFCGGTTTERPFDVQKHKDGLNVPTLEDIAQLFGDFLEAEYHHHPHLGDGLKGKTPMQVFTANIRERRPVPVDLLDLELSRRVVVKVGRNGVRANNLDYESPELDRLLGSQVVVLVNDLDVSRVTIADLDGRIIGSASEIQGVPRNATSEQLSEAMRTIRRDARFVREAEPATRRLRVAPDTAGRLQRQAIQKRREHEAAIASMNLPAPVVRQHVPTIYGAPLVDQRAEDRPRLRLVGHEDEHAGDDDVIVYTPEQEEAIRRAADPFYFEPDSGRKAGNQ